MNTNSANGYLVHSEVLAIADSAGANIVAATSSTINTDLSNKKVIVQLEILEVCAGDGALDVAIQGSLDGLNWVDLDASTVADVDPTGLNTGIAVADLTSLYAPYYRLRVFSDGTDTADACSVKVSIANNS